MIPQSFFFSVMPGLWRSILRIALLTSDFEYEASLDVARIKLNTLLSDALVRAGKKGEALVSFTVAERSFSWALPEALTGKGIIAAAEQVLEAVEGLTTAAEAKRLLRFPGRRVRQFPSFTAH